MNPKKKVAVRILERLESAGYEAYLVGGCVRDLYLNREPEDYDICTNAHPSTVQQLFAYTIPTGLKHGTVTVIEEDIPFEVTTFREEAGYDDHRRPSSIQFVSDLTRDLARRDFTMNAMALDRLGKLIDPFHGREDIRNRRIRCVGDPEERFTEDALRMIRAARFAAQFQFSLDSQVIEAIDACKEYVNYLAIERIVAEMEKIFCAPTPSMGFITFWEHSLWDHLPVFQSFSWREVGQAERTCFDGLSDRIVSWALLLYLAQVSASEIPQACRKLKLSKKDTQRIRDCFHLANQWEDSINDNAYILYLLRYGLDTTLRAYDLSKKIKQEQPDASMKQRLKDIWKSLPAKSVSELDVDGRDFLSYTSRQPGSWIRQTLDYLLIQVSLGEIPNQKKILLKEGSQFAAKNW